MVYHLIPFLFHPHNREFCIQNIECKTHNDGNKNDNTGKQ